MSKLTFRYGAVSSAKTLNLLAVAHQHERQGKEVVVLKPSVDTRDGATAIRSRAGLEREACRLVEDDTVLDPADFADVHCVLVDEAQFLSEALVDQLRELTRTQDVLVIAFGLRTDFRARLFPGSRRLLELADSIEEVKTACAFCSGKAIFNLRYRDGVPTTEGPSLLLGGDETYRGVCWHHYRTELDRAAADPDPDPAAEPAADPDRA